MEYLYSKYVNEMNTFMIIEADSSTTSANVLFAEYLNNGAGSTTSARASFSTQLTSSTISAYSIGSILGSGYASWVDADYL